MADALGLTQQGSDPADLTTDYLGQRTAVSFKGQPALPTASGGPGTAAPQTVAGGGASAPPPKILGPDGQPSDFSKLAEIFASEKGSQSGDAGPGESGPSVGGQLGGLPSATGEFAGLTFSGSPFGGSARGPAGVGITASPTGRVGFTTGNTALDHGIGAAASALGLTLSTNVLSALATLAGGPIASVLGATLGPAAMPFALVALAHQVATGMPTSVVNMQNAINEANPELHLTEAQAQQIAQYGARAFAGPTHGGPQAIGDLPFDNPVTNVNASTQAAPTTPAQNLSDMTLSPTFAQLAQALGFGTNREDVGPTADPNATAPANEATASATAGTGVSSSTGAEGAPAGPAGDTGGSSDAF